MNLSQINFRRLRVSLILAHDTSVYFVTYILSIPEKCFFSLSYSIDSFSIALTHECDCYVYTTRGGLIILGFSAFFRARTIGIVGTGSDVTSFPLKAALDRLAVTARSGPGFSSKRSLSRCLYQYLKITLVMLGQSRYV